MSILFSYLFRYGSTIRLIHICKEIIMENCQAFFFNQIQYLDTSYPDGITNIMHFLFISFPSESKITDGLLVLSFPIVFLVFIINLISHSL